MSLKKGGKVDLETLLAAVDAVTEGRTNTATSIMTAEKTAALENKDQADSTGGESDSSAHE